ncbi:MAG: ATP-binding protein [Sterolibacterium sp.]|jgi:PAS domain S-box-containing protein
MWRLEQRRFELEQARVSEMAGDHAHLLQAGIERVLSATFSLAALVREGKGHISNFEATATEMLPFFPGAASLQLAPGGVVRQIVPLAGNEAAIGHDLFNDPQRRKEAIKARDDGQLTLAGPFALKQGGFGAVGRMPTYLDDGAGGRSFWGFTNVLIRFPEALASARLENLEKRGFRYELWRVHPDTGERQIIAASSSGPPIEPVDRSLELPNGSWTLSVAPAAGWSDPGGLALKSALGLAVSLLLFLLTQALLNTRAKALQIAKELTYELRESEERYHLVFENSPVSIWEEDFSAVKTLLDGLRREGVADIETYLDRHPETIRRCAELARIVDVNRAALTLHAAAEKEELLAGLVNTFTPESFDTFRQELVYLWNGKTEMTRDSVVKTLAGIPRHVTVYYAVCPGYEQTLSRILVSLVDITERKRVEEALLFVAQRGWQVTGENFFDALAQFLGEKLEMDYVLIDRIDEDPDMAETVAMFAKGAITPNMRYALKGTPCENVMGRRLCVYRQGIQQLFPDDTLLPGMGAESYIGIPLWDSTGQPIGLIAVMGIKPLPDDAPVTQLLQLVATRAAAELERERSDRLLRAREYEFRTLAANLPDNIVRYNLEGRTVYVNRVLEATLGADAARMLGARIRELYPDGSYEAYAQAVDAALASGETGEIELIVPVASKESIVHQVRIIAERDEHGEVTGVLAIGRDITERKRAEEEIRTLNAELEQRVAERTAQLESANKELEAFSYSVSHDLRAPLRHIDGFLQLLRESTAAATDADSQHYMATITQAARRMELLIDDLLSFSRMGRAEMARTQVDLTALVREVIRELEAETHGRVIDWRIAELPVVTGDRAMLRVVLVNLLSNALKFTRQRAQAEIEIGCEAGHEGEIVVFVRDNGVGFDMRYVDKLFGVFQRLHRAEEFEGTGIGLANVRRVISRHGGRTWAEGSVGEGAVFKFSLPTTAMPNTTEIHRL